MTEQITKKELEAPIPTATYKKLYQFPPGAQLKLQMPFYQHRNYHYKDKTVSRTIDLYNGNPIPGKTVFILRRTPGPCFNIP